MPSHIFTYGSLMFPAVWKRVVRGEYRFSNAVLEQHARYAVIDAGYPGMVAQYGAMVEGVLYLDVDSEDVARLDAFEGGEYRRAGVPVALPDGTRRDAQTYLFMLPKRLRPEPWDATAFDLHDFLRRYGPGT